MAIISNILYRTSDWFLDVFMPTVIGVPFIVFEVLLLLYLQGTIIKSFAVANIPLFLMDILLWFGSCVVSCMI